MFYNMSFRIYCESRGGIYAPLIKVIYRFVLYLTRKIISHYQSDEFLVRRSRLGEDGKHLYFQAKEQKEYQMYEVKSDLNFISGGYYSNYIGDLACIVGEEIVRLMHCEIVTGDLPWLRGLICKEISTF